jgi:hypothetical protein
MSYTKTRAWAAGWMAKLVGYGWNNSEVINWLKDRSTQEIKLTYRRQDMIHDLNRMRLESIAAAGIPRLPLDTPIPDSDMNTFVGKMPTNYRVIYEVGHLEEGNRFVVDGLRTFFFDKAPSQEDFARAFQERDAELYGPVSSGRVVGNITWYKREGL